MLLNSLNHPLFDKKATLLGILFIGMLTVSCNRGETKLEVTTSDQHEEAVTKVMQNHLDAVSNRDLHILKTTLPPNGNMQFILPGREITNTTEDFLQYHREWFQDTTWTLESKILDAEIGEKIGVVITEVLYREPDREGIPYFNRMIVSYGLKNIDGQWYVFKDHASSVKTSEEP